MNDTKIIACSIEGCETIAKTIGLCNTHYMAQWRKQQRQIEMELIDAAKKYGSPESYECEGNDFEQCPNTPDRWWVNVSNNTAQAMCPTCSERIIEAMRLDIRRLELKQ